MITDGLHRSCVDVLDGWRPPDPDQDQLRRAYLDHLQARPDGWARSCAGAHLTASTLICAPDADQVLLVLHRKVGRWLQAGGHIEPGDASLTDAALREATEESGLPGLTLDPEPLLLSRHPVPFCGPGGSDHLDVQFLATVDGLPEPAVSEESAAVRWFEACEIPTEDASVTALVAAARARLGLSRVTR